MQGNPYPDIDSYAIIFLISISGDEQFWKMPMKVLNGSSGVCLRTVLTDDDIIFQSCVMSNDVLNAYAGII